MNPKIAAIEDAREMGQILRSAKCLKRYDKISHELLSEILVSIVTDGEVIGRNNRGSDIVSPTFGLIEVKSRILGTDGPFPRVSLKSHHIEKANWIAAIRWSKDFSLQDAVMLAATGAGLLYEAKRQKGGVAHIAWKDWAAASGAVSILSKCLGVLETTDIRELG